MTHDEFWAKVRAAGPWQVRPSGIVRSDRGCPLQAAFGVWYHENGGLQALPQLVATNIVDAADRPRSPYRPLLLRALGLT